MQKISSQPLLSIGLPVYNGEQYLRSSLDSILSQTFEDFELIISDNASTDDTPRICREYAAADDRIRYIRNEKNLGGSYNFNRLVELGSGKYFRWAADDDIILPDFLAECIRILEQYPEVVLCYTKTKTIDEDGKPVDKTPSELHLKSLDLRSPNPHERFDQYLQEYYPIGGKCDPIFGVMRRKMLAETAMIDSYPASDMVMLGEIALKGQIYEIDERLFLRRDHPGTFVRANPTLEERMRWLDPESEEDSILPYLHRLSVYIAAINRVSLSPRERFWCYVALVRRYVRHRWRFMRDEIVYSLKGSLPSKEPLHD